MTTLLYISLAIFLSYVIGTCLYLREIPNSISKTYYMLGKYGFLFTLFCWGVSFTLIPYILENSKENTEFLAALAIGGMGFVGAAPMFLDDFEGKVHQWGAIFCIVFSQIWAFIHCWWIALICWAIYVIGTIVYMKKHKESDIKRTFLRTKPMFWVEIAAFASTYLILFK